ncbi:MAG: diaminopimelate decarboxylase [Alphaproteobacteria bacterium]|jgi:diaminopimelate decarboxylase|nr:diaminopimelate decarboxylase [Alphaproteobacteria bacterium]
MHHFHYRDEELHCEEVPLRAIAEAVGTPCYVYSTATMTRHVRVIAEAFTDIASLIAYSVKANGNLAVLATLARLGCGADVVSGGELKRARAAGIAGERIVFSGVGKTRDDMALALSEGIHQFNVESAGELRALSQVASAMGRDAPVALRVNPDVAAGGHPNISTGKSGDKFGVPWHETRDLYALAAQLPGIHVSGVDVHIGSQIGDLAPMRAAFEKTVDLTRELRERGHPITRIDVGGGLAIPYRDGDTPAPPSAYAGMIREVVGDLDVEVILEPGRVIMGNAGVMLSQALYLKDAPDRTFLILDAGMNDLMRPALYEAHHDVWPLAAPRADTALKSYDIVGPICESTDKFAARREMREVRPGDRLAFMSAGAYGAVLSSQYNARPLVAEILVDGDRFDIVRRRPIFEEMLQLEDLPDWLT